MFPHLSTIEDNALLKLSTALYFRKGETLLQQGSHSDHIFAIRKGRVRVQQTLDGTTRQIARLRQGDVYDLISFTANVPSQFRFVAEEDGVYVRAIPTASLVQLIGEDTAFSNRFYQSVSYLLAKQLHSSYQRFGALMDTTHRKRVSERIDVRADIEGLPRVVHELITHWGTPFCSTYLNDLIINPTGMDRQGFPPEVFTEIMFLYSLLTSTGAPKS